MSEDWREEALAEIDSIRSIWKERFGWRPEIRKHEDHIDLYVHFSREQTENDTYVLRLRYLPDFKTAGRAEAFVNPDDFKDEGTEFWPTGSNAFKPNRDSPAICLEGTRGFHTDLHRDRDARKASLNKLLLEIQRCLDQ